MEVIAKNKIAIIAGNVNLFETANEVTEEFNEEIIVYKANTENYIEIAQHALANGSNVIISRGVFSRKIEQKFNLSVIDIPLSTADLLKTMKKVDSNGKLVGLILHKSVFFDVKEFHEIVTNQVLFGIYDDFREINSILIDFHQNRGIDTIIGGEATLDMAKDLGLNYFQETILLENSKESVRNAILEAIRLVKMQANEEEKYILFRAISDYNRDGIVFVDDKLKIKYVNPIAEKVLETNAENIIGTDASYIFSSSHLINIQQKGSHILAVYEEINGMKLVSNYIPIKLGDQIVGSIVSFQDVSKIEEIERTIRRERTKKGLVAKYRFNDILTKDDIMLCTLNNAKKVAKTDSTVLICGESGTGKELIAQSIHNESSRKHGPFVAVNCAALPASLLESELFGYCEGAFTGAKKSGKLGLFENAHMGTIFLDEIGDISLEVQSRLLRVIQEKEVIRIGDDKIIPVDIRIIAASNKNLYEMLQHKSFREDLYYRLDIVRIQVPPLRERIEDIEYLCQHFLRHFAKCNNKSIINITSKAIKILETYTWPGNIRELEHFIESIVILYEGKMLDHVNIKNFMINKSKYKQFNLIEYQNESDEYNARIYKKDVDDKNINQVLQKLKYQRTKDALIGAQGDKVKAAQILGISTTTLWRRIKSIENSN